VINPDEKDFKYSPNSLNKYTGLSDFEFDSKVVFLIYREII